MRPLPVPALLLALAAVLASPAVLAGNDPDDPPPLAPVREPSPVEPPPDRLVLAQADPAPCASRPGAGLPTRAPQGRADRPDAAPARASPSASA